MTNKAPKNPTYWRELAENLRARDENAVNALNGQPEIGIENRIGLANDRALDALAAVHKVLLWIAEQEEQQ